METKKYKLQGSHKGHIVQVTFPDVAGFYHVYVDEVLVKAVQTLDDALAEFSKQLKKEEN